MRFDSSDKELGLKQGVETWEVTKIMPRVETLLQGRAVVGQLERIAVLVMFAKRMVFG